MIFFMLYEYYTSFTLFQEDNKETRILPRRKKYEFNSFTGCLLSYGKSMEIINLLINIIFHHIIHLGQVHSSRLYS